MALEALKCVLPPELSHFLHCTILGLAPLCNDITKQTEGRASKSSDNRSNTNPTQSRKKPNLGTIGDVINENPGLLPLRSAYGHDPEWMAFCRLFTGELPAAACTPSHLVVGSVPTLAQNNIPFDCIAPSTLQLDLEKALGGTPSTANSGKATRAANAHPGGTVNSQPGTTGTFHSNSTDGSEDYNEITEEFRALRVAPQSPLDSDARTHLSAQLQDCLPVVLTVLHLLYESLKIQTAQWPLLKPLAQLLFDLATHLRWHNYCLLYCCDFPGLIPSNGAFSDSSQPAQEWSNSCKALCDSKIAYFQTSDDPPNIYQWISRRLKGEENESFPVLRQPPHATHIPPTDIVRVTCRLYDLMCSDQTHVIQRYEASSIYTCEMGTGSPRSPATPALTPDEMQLLQEECTWQLPSEHVEPLVDPLTGGNGSQRVVLGMVCEGITTNDLNKMAYGIAQCFREALFECRNRPATNWTAETYLLIGREDLASLLQPPQPEPDNNGSGSATAPPNNTEESDNYTGCEVGAAGELGKFLWGDDGRLALVQNMLSTSLPVRLNTKTESSGDPMQEQQTQLQRIAKRILSISVGRGALTLSTIHNRPTDMVKIPPIVFAGKRGKNEALLKLDVSTTPPDVLLWPQFHNGCAAGLRLKGSNLYRSANPNTQSKGTITRDWILYHYPAQPTPANAGMLFALGLQQHLACLALTDIFRFMSMRHDTTTIAVLIGLAAAHRGEMNVAIARMLSLHLAAITPAYPDIEVSLSVQTAALVGVGLLYQGSRHRFMTELLLGELGRAPSDEHCTNREGYALAAGIALGLVCLGQGSNAAGLADLRLEDKLYAYMTGMQRENLDAFDADLDPDLGDEGSMDFYMRRRPAMMLHPCSRILEGRMVNVSVTGAGATIALGLMYLMSNNKSVASRLAVPSTGYLLDYLTPDGALLRVCAQTLVLWDDCIPTRQWILGNVPMVVKNTVDRLRNRSILDDDETEEAERGIGGGGTEHSITLYCHIIAGALLGMGMRYAGTERLDIRDLMLAQLKGFVDGRCGDINVAVKSLSTNKNSIDVCITATVLAVACVMAGSGDYETLGIFRKLWKREEVSYGQHMAVGMGIGLLFLGAGHLSLCRDQASIAALLIACYPRFPAESADDSYHLQALRHLYVLACVPSILETRDVDTRMPCYLPVRVHLKTGINVPSPADTHRSHPTTPFSVWNTNASPPPTGPTSRKKLSGGPAISLSSPSPSHVDRSVERVSAGNMSAVNISTDDINLTTQNVILDRTAPCLLPPPNTIEKIVVRSPRYFPLILDTANPLHLQALQLGATIYVKRRSGFLSYFDDPKGVRNLLSIRTTNIHSLYNTALMYNNPTAATNATDTSIDGGDDSFTPPLYSDPTISLFAQYFGDATQHPSFYKRAIQECVHNENTEMLPVYQLMESAVSSLVGIGSSHAPTSVYHCLLLHNTRIVCQLYNSTYNKTNRNTLLTQNFYNSSLDSPSYFRNQTPTFGPQSEGRESTRGVGYDDINAPMLESNTLLSLPFVKAIQVIVEHFLTRFCGTTVTVNKGDLPPVSSTNPNNTSVLTQYIKRHRFPTSNDITGMLGNTTPGNQSQYTSTLHCRTVFGCFLQYYEIPSPLQCCEAIRNAWNALSLPVHTPIGTVTGQSTPGRLATAGCGMEEEEMMLDEGVAQMQQQPVSLPVKLLVPFLSLQLPHMEPAMLEILAKHYDE